MVTHLRDRGERGRKIYRQTNRRRYREEDRKKWREIEKKRKNRDI
jgi:hypothetical protein